MTKAKVISLAKKQNAKVIIEPFGKTFSADIELPDGYVWDNGHHNGTMGLEYDPDLDGTRGEFWAYLYSQIDFPVIKLENK